MNVEKITIITRDGEVFSTETDRIMSIEDEIIQHFTIDGDTYYLQESLRVIKFRNFMGEKITIPFENINSITEQKD